MVWEFILKGLGVLVAFGIGWLLLFICARTIFIAYFQTKITFTRPHQEKEIQRGKEKQG